MENTLEALEDELRKNPEYVDEYIKLLEAENEALRAELARLKDIAKRIVDNTITSHILLAEDPYELLTTMDDTLEARPEPTP